MCSPCLTIASGRPFSDLQDRFAGEVEAVVKEEFEVLPILIHKVDGDAFYGKRLLDNVDDLHEHVVQVEDRADGP